MKIAIIEDEKLTAEDLAETILRIDPNIQIAAVLSSVKQAVTYFSKHEKPDLIFSDIQLGDGLSFKIFESIPYNVPVIFCTAYDDYALNAFKANGIDYILKPFSKQVIEQSLNKFLRLKDSLSSIPVNYEKISELFSQKKNYNDGSILIYSKDKIVPVKLSDIALFYIENEINHLVTFGQKVHNVGKTMEELERMTCDKFYRVNRKYLVNREAIKDASQHFHRKLLVNLSVPFTPSEPITVSKEKATEFLNWLAGN